MDATIMNQAKPLIKTSAAAQMIGVCVSTVRRLATHGDLPCIRGGSRGDYRFAEEDVRAMRELYQEGHRPRYKS